MMTPRGDRRPQGSPVRRPLQESSADEDGGTVRSRAAGTGGGVDAGGEGKRGSQTASGRFCPLLTELEKAA